MFFLYFYTAAWLAGILYCLHRRIHSPEGVAGVLLTAHFAVTVGCGMLFNFTGQFFYSRMVADMIGWSSNGFQKEVAIISLGIGICGLLCVKIRDGFRLAVALIYAVFMAGAGLYHLWDYIQTGNASPGNVGIILPDLLMPATVLALWLAQWSRQRRTENGSLVRH